MPDAASGLSRASPRDLQHHPASHLDGVDASPAVPTWEFPRGVGLPVPGLALGLQQRGSSRFVSTGYANVAATAKSLA